MNADVVGSRLLYTVALGVAWIATTFSGAVGQAAAEKDRSTLFKRRPMVVKRDFPEAWKQLAPGAQFIDRIEPLPAVGPLTSDAWGGDNVRPRYIENGIEDREWTYWGGNALPGPDGKHHLIVCRWPESSPGGHAYYFHSDVVHAVADHGYGPYRVVETLFPGHNPYLFQLHDGRYVIKSGFKLWVGEQSRNPGSSTRFETLAPLGEAWREIPLVMNNRERIKREQKLMSFTMREDGSFLGLTRHGDIWVSETGISPYQRITDDRVYPAIAGRFEDPVIWRTHVQYHLITNDWQGRVAYHMRSKDGVHWKLDPGIAYKPGIVRHEDGTIEDWYKLEVIRVFQDEHGRAVRVNFAALDCPKAEDLENDNHNSKVVFIPLTPGRLLTVLNTDPINACTETIRVLIEAEEGFDPRRDIDLESLRFGAPEEVDFGQGCRLIRTEPADEDVILVFEGSGNGFKADNFAGKMLGRTTDGKLLFGYSRLPGIDYIEPILSPMPAKFTPIAGGVRIEVEVQNFGQAASETADLKVLIREGMGNYHSVWGKIPPLEPYEKTTVVLNRMEDTSRFRLGQEYTVTVRIEYPGRQTEDLTRKTIILPEEKRK